MKIQKWKVLKTEDVSPSKWFPVEKHTVQLADGTIVDDYFKSNLGIAVMVLPVTKDGEIVFVRQYKHGLGDITIELPAGFPRKGQSFEEGAVTELEEETGIKFLIENLQPLGDFTNLPTKIYDLTRGYLAKDVEFNSYQNLDQNEASGLEVLQIKPNQVLEMIKSGEIWVSDTVALVLKVKLMYPEIFDGK